MPVALVIDYSASLVGTGAPRSHFIFATREEAESAFTAVRDAAIGYHSRANDRERMVTLRPVSGPASVDVTNIASVFVDDALGECRPLLEEWNRGIAQISRASAIEAATAGETGTGSTGGKSAVAKPDAQPNS